jgi:hypothetical protein
MKSGLPPLCLEVDDILRKLQRERSALVLKPVYDDLLKTFHDRKNLFDLLEHAAPPQDDDESYKIVREAVEDWMRARDELKAALEVLSDYLSAQATTAAKTRPQTSPQKDSKEEEGKTKSGRQKKGRKQPEKT